MIDLTCCFINNLKKSKNDSISEYAKSVITTEFETAVSDGYKLFLLSAQNKSDVDVIKLLTEAKKNYENLGLTIQVTVEKELFIDGGSCNYTAEEKRYIKDNVLECRADVVTIYRGMNYGSRYHSLAHYTLSHSTRVILLRDTISDNKKKKEIDDFFISITLNKDVKKLMICENQSTTLTCR